MPHAAEVVRPRADHFQRSTTNGKHAQVIDDAIGVTKKHERIQPDRALKLVDAKEKQHHIHLKQTDFERIKVGHGMKVELRGEKERFCVASTGDCRLHKKEWSRTLQKNFQLQSVLPLSARFGNFECVLQHQRFSLRRAQASRK
jgi:hypothetical protein